MVLADLDVVVTWGGYGGRPAQEKADREHDPFHVFCRG